VLGLSRRELAGLVALFVATLPAVTARLYSSDEVQYFSYLRSLWFDHDVSFENEYRYFFDRGVARTPGFEATFLEPFTPSGRRVNFGTIGSALLWAPFYALGDVSARVLRASGRDVAVDGFSQPYIAAVAYASALYGFLAIVLSAGAARRVTGYGVAPALIVWAGTPLLFYMYAAPPYSHACSAFAVALFVTIWMHVRREWSGAGLAALGAAAALMTMVREQDLFFAVGPALDFVLTANADRESVALRLRTKAFAGAVAMFGLCMMPQLMAYQALNGRPSPSTLVSRKMTWTAPHALQVLLSPEHGFFFWTPIAIVAIGGLVVLAVRGVPGHLDSRRIGLCALVMVAMQVYVSGSVESWTVAGAFGQRRFVALTILLAIGVGTLWRAAVDVSPLSRYALAVAAAVAIWWNVAMMVLFGANLMDRQRLQLGRNAYDAFVTLPRIAPQIAYRYFLRRDSFYQTPPHPETE
jgi:hypothetical protein